MTKLAYRPIQCFSAFYAHVKLYSPMGSQKRDRNNIGGRATTKIKSLWSFWQRRGAPGSFESSRLVQFSYRQGYLANQYAQGKVTFGAA